jgi:hypothetical protein
MSRHLIVPDDPDGRRTSYWLRQAGPSRSMSRRPTGGRRLGPTILRTARHRVYRRLNCPLGAPIAYLRRTADLRRTSYRRASSR